MDILGRYVAVDDKCAWPNLTLMPDGSIVATIFSEPTHHGWEGDTECWVSRDGGRNWSFLGVPAPHEPGTNRINAAAGLTQSGAFVALCNGHRDCPPPPPRMKHFGDSRNNSLVEEKSSSFENLEPWVCRSEDGGKEWSHCVGITIPSELSNATPFGDIVQLPDNRLAASCYCYHSNDEMKSSAWIFFSEDDGRKWGDSCPIAVGTYNESDLLHLGDGHLLAVIRTDKPIWRPGIKKHVENLEIFASDDSGRTWVCRGSVSLPKQCPGHLCRLKDGRILLTYGVRNQGMLGVCARVSSDEGLTWDAPRVLFSTEARRVSSDPSHVDGGYPSSVQLEDGILVTAYYSSSIPMHQRYHMGVVRWEE